MVSQMQNLKSFRVPAVELLGHVIEVYLMNDHVELVDLGQDVHLELTTPDALLPDKSDVTINRHVIFDEELVLFFVVVKVVGDLSAKHDVLILHTVELIGDRSEKAVSISSDILHPEVLLAKFDLELREVNSLLFKKLRNGDRVLVFAIVFLFFSIRVVLDLLLLFIIFLDGL